MVTKWGLQSTEPNKFTAGTRLNAARRTLSMLKLKMFGIQTKTYVPGSIRVEIGRFRKSMGFSWIPFWKDYEITDTGIKVKIDNR